jgi:hypothetical protein
VKLNGILERKFLSRNVHRTPLRLTTAAPAPGCCIGLGLGLELEFNAPSTIAPDGTSPNPWSLSPGKTFPPGKTGAAANEAVRRNAVIGVAVPLPIRLWLFDVLGEFAVPVARTLSAAKLPNGEAPIALLLVGK